MGVPNAVKVIVTYIGKRREPPQTPEEVCRLLNFVIQTEMKLDPGVPMDTILVHNGGDLLGNTDGHRLLRSFSCISTKRGTLRIVNRENVGLSFGAYDEMYRKLRKQYEYWCFCEDDYVLLKDGWMAMAIGQLQQHKAGFVYATCLNNFNGKEHVVGACGVSRRSVLDAVCAENDGRLPCHVGNTPYDGQVENGEVEFTNIMLRIGYDLIEMHGSSRVAFYRNKWPYFPGRAEWKGEYEQLQCFCDLRPSLKESDTYYCERCGHRFQTQDPDSVYWPCDGYEARDRPTLFKKSQYCRPAEAVITKRRLIFHLAPLNGTNWRWHAERLKRHWKLFNDGKFIGVGIGEDTDSLESVKAEFPADAQWIVRDNDPALQEMTTFPALMEAAYTKDENTAIFRAHSKGVKHPPCGVAWLWTAAMYWLCLRKYKEFVEPALNELPCAAPFIFEGRAFGATRFFPWHPMGSFYWFHAASVYSHPLWNDYDLQWYFVEPYLAQLFPRTKCKNLCVSGTVCMYHIDEWKKHVIPRLAELGFHVPNIDDYTGGFAPQPGMNGAQLRAAPAVAAPFP